MRLLLVSDDGVEARISAMDYVFRYNEIMKDKPKIVQHLLTDPTEKEITSMAEDFPTLKFTREASGWFVTSLDHKGVEIRRQIHMIDADLSLSQ